MQSSTQQRRFWSAALIFVALLVAMNFAWGYSGQTRAAFDQADAFDLDASLGSQRPAPDSLFTVITGLPESSTPDQALAALKAMRQSDNQTTSNAAQNNTVKREPFDTQQIYELNDKHALWLHMRVKSALPAQQRWVLMLENAFIDRVEQYVRSEALGGSTKPSASGQWYREMAGDRFAHRQWTHSTLMPQTLLPVMVTGEHDVLIKVSNSYSQQIPLLLMPQQEAEEKNRHDFLFAGFLLGFLGVVFLLALHLAFTYRDAVYAWYAAYMLLSGLAVSTYLGMAGYAFWPFATQWPQHAILILILATVTVQVWFCQMMFLREGQQQLLRTAAYATVGLSIFLGLMQLLIPDATQRNIVFATGFGLCVVMITVIVIVTIWNTRQKAAYIWVLAYSPLFIATSLSIAKHLNWAPGIELPYDLPVYPLVFEAIVLLASLHIHAKERHAQQEREKSLTAFDPLTGFLNAKTFRNRWKDLWMRSIEQDKDIAIAFIKLQHKASLNDSESVLQLEHKLMRSVRLLNAIMRSVDVVGRIDVSTLAVAMPGIPMGEELNNRLARLVAQGLMLDTYDEQSREIHFRIVAGTRQSHGNQLAAIEARLQYELNQTLGWQNKPIRYLQALRPAETLSPTQADSSSLNTLDVAQLLDANDSLGRSSDSQTTAFADSRETKYAC